MKRILTIVPCFFLVGLIVSCNSEKKPHTSETLTETIKTCFESISKDTVQLVLETTGNKVKGTLRFNLYEKDLNEGTLEGEMRGDTLIADYNFYSEGIASVREVVFLKRDNQLIEGFGETTNVNGKQVFKNRSTLSFNNSLVLTSAECDNKYGIIE